MKNGGKRAGAGRPPGKLNHRTRDLKDLADRYTARCVKVAAEIMADGNARHADRLEAVKILLDRGHGKPRQEFDVTGKLTLEQLVEASLKPDGDGGGTGSAPLLA